MLSIVLELPEKSNTILFISVLPVPRTSDHFLPYTSYTIALFQNTCDLNDYVLHSLQHRLWTAVTTLCLLIYS
jgi:hypothetical protein